MTPAKKLLLGALGAVAMTFASCSNGSPTTASITSVVQDLDRDPEGRQTVFSFDADVGVIGPANFEASGGQTPTGLELSLGGRTVVITWDERVTPSDQVRMVGTDIESAFVAVESTDQDPPTFEVVDATQTEGLGGDTFTVQFDGARVVTEDVVDPANWSLRVEAIALDLTGSSFVFDQEDQTLAVTLGLLANLHADFTLSANGVRSVSDILVGGSNVPGSATGDSQSPTLQSAAQNLDEDEFGRVIDFTFDEAMDPVFSANITNFSAGFPVFATSVTLPEEEILRVTFSAPIIPGSDEIELLDIVDAHGNDAAGGDVAIAAGTTIDNDFETDPQFLTVENAGGDELTIVFDQAIAPVDAGDDEHWTLTVNAVPVDLADELLLYDLMERSLTIRLDDDYTTGDAFEFSAAVGNLPRDVDGQAFDKSFAGNIGGDTKKPTVVSVTQNRTADADGQTLDIVFSEDVDETLAEDEANYSVAGLTVDSATLLGSGETVRLELDGLVVPGDVTLDASLVADLAGNTMDAAAANAIVSSDGAEPQFLSPVAEAFAGVDNDTLTVTFDDDMIAAEVEDVDNWLLESPIGTALDTSAATVTYDDEARQAVLVFDGGDDINFHKDDDFRVRLTSMRDLGGNEIDVVDRDTDVTAERDLPRVESIWVDGGDTSLVYVRFNEPVDMVDDLFDAATNPGGLTRYEVYTAASALKGEPDTVTLSADGFSAELDFSFGVVAASDTLSVFGVTDLARNQMFPISESAIAAEDADEPALDVGVSTLVAVSGEDNDVVTVSFDRGVSAWGLTDPDNWSLSGPAVIDLDEARFTVLGRTSVQIDLPGAAGDLEFNADYTLEVDNLFSEQGVEMSAASTELITAGGDTTAPTLSAVRVDAQDSTSLIVELDEALHADDAADETLLDILATNPTSAVKLGPRTLRATFAAAPAPGDTLNFTTVRDLAGNAGTISLAVAAAASDGPLPTSVAGTVEPGVGGDIIEIEFDQPVEPVTALDIDNYSVTNGSSIDLSGASIAFDSTVPRVVISLPQGVELDANSALMVGISNIENHDGFPMAGTAAMGGVVGGDADAPTAVQSFVNYREDSASRRIDVEFSEALDDTNVLSTSVWSASGGQSVMDVTEVNDGVYRIRLATALVDGQTLSVNAATDLAGNEAATLTFTPVF